MPMPAVPCPHCGAAVAPVRIQGGALLCPRCKNRGRSGRPAAGRSVAIALLAVALAALAGGGLLLILDMDAAVLPGSRSTGLDGSAPPAPEPPVDGVYARKYSWDYGGSTWTFSLHIPDDVYRGFHDAERPVRYIDEGGTRVRQMAYDIFVTTPSDDLYVQELARQLSDAADGQGWSDDDTLSFALSFVQSLRYTSDRTSAGFDEYPRYPIETLVDEGGDCEDTSILYASLVQALGYGVVLVSPPAHMAVGVAAQTQDARTITVGSQPYLYAETTGDGWEIGEIPDEYQGGQLEIFSLVPQPLFDLDVQYGAVNGGLQSITLTATATGSAVAYDIELFTGIALPEGRYLDTDKCSVGTVSPGETASCKLSLDLRKVPPGRQVEIHSQVQDGRYYYAREVSAPYVRG